MPRATRNRTLIAQARVSEAELSRVASQGGSSRRGAVGVVAAGDGADTHLDRSRRPKSSGSAPASWRGSART